MSGRASNASHKLQMSYILNDGEDRPRHDPMDVDTPSSSSANRRRPSSSSSRRPPSASDGERKYVCPECKFPFRSKGDMQKHIKTVHLGIKDHKCPKCGARFAEKGNLTKHMKRHEGNRVWKCSVKGCDKTFVLSDGLARHERSVHGLQDSGSSSRHASVSTSSTTRRSSTQYHSSSRSRN